MEREADLAEALAFARLNFATAGDLDEGGLGRDNSSREEF
jgi:hypothetical protein